MKTAITVFGIVVLCLLSIGTLFKVMHWPGANVALILSIGLLPFFLGMLFVVTLQTESSDMAKIARGLGVFAGTVYATGILFKIMHWPGGNVMLMFGMFLLFFIFLPSYLIGMKQNKVEVKLNTHTILVLAMFGMLMIAYAGKRPSYSLMDEFCRINNRIMQSTASSGRSRGNMYALLENMSHSPSDGLGGSYDKAMALKIRSREMIGYIEGLKSELIYDTDGLDTKQHVSEVNGVDTPDSTSLNTSMSLDNNVIATHFMLGEGLGSKSGKAYELMEKIENYKADLSTFISDPTHVDLGLELGDKYDERQDMNFTWPEHYFYNTTLAGTITTLTSLETEVGNTETAVLLEILKEARTKNAENKSK